MITNAFTQSPVGSVNLASRTQLDAAVKAATAAQKQYRNWKAYERSEALLRCARLVEERKADFIRTISVEVGKPVKAAGHEVERAIATFTIAAEEAKRLGGELLPIDVDHARGQDTRFAFTFRQPIGVVLAICPFNFPLNLAVHKVAPALAAGNAVLIKPSLECVGSTVLLLRVLQDAGFPAGVVNHVPCSDEIAGSLVQHAEVNMVSFTGSVATGRLVLREAGLKRVGLELGGNGPNIVTESADLDSAAEALTRGGFTFAGQLCLGVQRIYVQEQVIAKFLEKLKARVEVLVVGDPAAAATDVGPMIVEESAARVEDWIKESLEAGARLVTGGRREGKVLFPTILSDVTNAMPVCCNEVFAPLVTVAPYGDFDGAIALSNESRYGLSAGVFTKDLGEAFRAVRELEVGAVIVNDSSLFRADHVPHGGIKESGLGREGVRYTIDEMTEIKYGCILL